jgi:NhaP-type Na+/H+ or K+/H+ antiporter
VTLLSPYVAWVLGESIHASAVLACVAGGLYLRQHFSSVVAPATRIQGRAVWDLLVFLLNGVIFILIGLQLGSLRAAVPPDRVGSLIVGGLIISATAILVRLVWVPLGVAVPRWISPELRKRDPFPPPTHVFLVGWIGMRGIVTLAAAMALPVSTNTGTPFPFRAEIILLSFAFILITLVLQGLTLAPLIRRLGVEEGKEGEQEEMHARERAAAAALSRLNDLSKEEWPKAQHLDQVRLNYDRRRARFAPSAEIDVECKKETSEAWLRLRQETLTAERLALIKLRDEGTIGDEVLHRLEQELDIEAIRLGLGERRVGG